MEARTSAMEAVDLSTSEEAVIQLAEAPVPIVGGTAQPPLIGSISAPVQSMFQTACIALRCILDCNWTLRHTGAVAAVTLLALHA